MWSLHPWPVHSIVNDMANASLDCLPIITEYNVSQQALKRCAIAHTRWRISMQTSALVVVVVVVSSHWLFVTRVLIGSLPLVH